MSIELMLEQSNSTLIIFRLDRYLAFNNISLILEIIVVVECHFVLSGLLPFSKYMISNRKLEELFKSIKWGMVM